jgi:hypothetical protein
MGFGTFLIGLLPTYDQIGIAAPLLLVLLRLLQGVGLGGEWGGAVLMVVENVSAKNRGFLGSMVQLGYPIGTLTATGMFALVSHVPESDFLAWAWRIPFLISVVLVGVGLYIRLRLDETPVFREIEAKKEVAKLPLIEVLTQHRRSFFTAVGLKLSEISYAQIGGVFAIAYVTGKLAMPRSVIFNAILLSSTVAIVAIPLFGWLSDRPQDDVLCKLPVRDGFRLPDVLASRHEGPADDHGDNHCGHHIRANGGVRSRGAVVFRTIRSKAALQRRFVRFPDWRGNQRWPHPVCGGDAHGQGRRRDMAGLSLPDRTRRRHFHRHSGRARDGRQAVGVRQVFA